MVGRVEIPFAEPTVAGPIEAVAELVGDDEAWLVQWDKQVDESQKASVWVEGRGWIKRAMCICW